MTRLISSSFSFTLLGPKTTRQIQWRISGLGVGFKPGLCREYSGSGKAGHGSGGWGLSGSWQEVAQGWVAALACWSSTFTKRNLIYQALDSDFIVPETPGMKGSIEALSRVQVPQFHLLEGSSSQAPPAIRVLTSRD